MRFPFPHKALSLTLLLWPLFAHSEWLSDRADIMGTQVSVTLWSDDPHQGQQAIAEVMADMRRIERTLSPYIETSDLVRVNRLAAQQPVPLSDEFYALVERAIHYGDLSGGAFDITFASVGFLYDYRQGQQPDAQQREALMPAVNYRWLKLDPARQSVAFEHANVRIDLGGIAKGHAVDRAVAILKRRGIEHATVSAGGDSRVLGDKRGKPWLIGVRNPRESARDQRQWVITLPLTDTAVSTSGDYERFFIDDDSGQRVHHILNPATGHSAHGVISTTVLGPNGIDTDALSTTVFVLGVEAGLKLLDSLPAFDGIVIDAGGQVHYSSGLAPPETE